MLRITSVSSKDSVKAFGKFYVNQAARLRSFEKAFNIETRTGAGAWKSQSPSVQNLLDHLSRQTRSESSREVYLNTVRRICEYHAMGPDELIHLSKEQAENLIQNYVDGLAATNRSKTYINSVIKRIRTFFRVNGFARNRELDIQTYFVPTRYRKTPEYIPTKHQIHSMANATGNLRDRAIILALWSSGVRVSTLSALNYRDISTEFEQGELHIKIQVYPEMKLRVPDACKGMIPYYTFIYPEAVEALRSYLKYRTEKYGQMMSNDPLFHSDWTLWNRTNRSTKRLGRRGIGLIVKKAARLAGIEEHKYVTPHCLRKAFESILRSQTVDGGQMDKGTQEFLMGHILPGTQDAYYDKMKVDFHREEYAKLNFSRDNISARMIDKLIGISELEKHLVNGWLFVAKVNENSVVVRSVGTQ